MGRGGCFSFLAEQTIGCARAICGLACCLLIGGPILFILGIVFLAAPNHRQDAVSQYNNAVDLWNQDGSLEMAFSSFHVGATSLGIVGNVPVIPVGSSSGVDSATSTYFCIDSVAYSPTTNATISVSANVSDANSSLALAVLPSRDEYNAYCNKSGGCNTPADFGCLPGTTYSNTPPTCDYEEYCGTCKGTLYLTGVCFIVQVTRALNGTSHWALSQNVGCSYPFQSSKDHSYTSIAQTSFISVSVRNVQDPSIQLALLTNGTLDIGITPEQQNAVGVACLVLGVLLTVCVFGTIAMVCCHRPSRRHGQVFYATVTGSAYTPVPEYSPMA